MSQSLSLERRVALRVARNVFAERGNRSEAHLGELELAAYIEVGIEALRMAQDLEFARALDAACAEIAGGAR